MLASVFAHALENNSNELLIYPQRQMKKRDLIAAYPSKAEQIEAICKEKIKKEDFERDTLFPDCEDEHYFAITIAAEWSLCLVLATFSNVT